MSEAENERCEEPTPQPETAAQASRSNCTETEHDDVSARRRPTAGRFARSIAMGLLIVSLPAIAAIWTLIRPKYTAQAEIHVIPIIPWIVFKGFGHEQRRYESYMNTQISVMRCPTVLNRVLGRPDVRQTQWFRNPYGPILAKLKTPPPPLERLREDLSVSPRGRTELVDIKMTTMKAKDAAVIANAVVEEYISYCSEKPDEEAEMRRRKLRRKRNQRCAALEADIKRRKQVIAKLRADLGASDPEESVSEILRKEIDALAQKQKERDYLLGLTYPHYSSLVQVLSRATVPSEPDSDWRIALTVAALVLGLAAGVAWAYRR